MKHIYFKVLIASSIFYYATNVLARIVIASTQYEVGINGFSALLNIFPDMYSISLKFLSSSVMHQYLIYASMKFGYSHIKLINSFLAVRLFPAFILYRSHLSNQAV